MKAYHSLSVYCNCGHRIEAYSHGPNVEFTCPHCKRHYILTCKLEVREPTWKRSAVAEVSAQPSS